jgi:hypothetical protein
MKKNALCAVIHSFEVFHEAGLGVFDRITPQDRDSAAQDHPIKSPAPCVRHFSHSFANDDS